MDNEPAENLAAIWQSELTAMAADRELRESWVAIIQLWAQAAKATAGLFAHDPASGGTVSAKPARPQTADAASEPGLDELSRLSQGVAELERHLAELLEQRDQSGPTTGDKPV